MKRKSAKEKQIAKKGMRYVIVKLSRVKASWP